MNIVMTKFFKNDSPDDSDSSSIVIKVESSDDEILSDNHDDQNLSPDKQTIKLVGDTSSKQIYRQFYDDPDSSIKSSIIIDFSRITCPSDEYFHVYNLCDTTQYEIFREINHFLYIKIPHNIRCRVPEIYASSDYFKTLQIEDLGSVSL